MNFYHPIALAGLKKMLLQATTPEDEKYLARHE
jgi:hypothetical protein